MKSEKDLEARLTALSDFQLSIVLHAFQFPSATKITYSTCSIHSQENEEVVMRALESRVARERGWQILKRQDQVSGMRDWPVRGLPEACRGDQSIADGCIRSYKNDGRGVMGFFVAAFVRPRSSEAEPGDAASEPYLRDEDGMIIRDVMGMPVLKSTGAVVSLGPRDENEADGEQDDDDGEDEEEEEDESSVSGSTPRSNDKESWDDEEEWTGLGN
jgi:putative methyltransferase